MRKKFNPIIFMSITHYMCKTEFRHSSTRYKLVLVGFIYYIAKDKKQVNFTSMQCKSVKT